MYKKLSENKKLRIRSSIHFITAGFFFILWSISLPVFSQKTGRYPVKRIRAFQQEETGGVNSVRDRVRVKKKFDWIYLEVWAGKSIEITHMWLNNELTGFRTEKINSPVFHPGSLSTGIKKIVIPASNNVVYQLFKTDAVPEQTDSLIATPAAFRRFPLLIRYQSEGKSYFLGAYPRQLPKQSNL